MTAIDIFRPSLRRQTWAFDAACIMAGAVFIALSAQAALRLPFSPVPITGQTLAALLVGAALGSRRGALCLLAYIAQGVAGLPVFANGGMGPLHLLGPTGGYLFGLVAAAYIAGLLAERGWDRRVSTTLVAMLLANAVLYVFGLLWLANFVGAERVLALGLLPFIPGDLFKIALAGVMLPGAWRLLGHRQ